MLWLPGFYGFSELFYKIHIRIWVHLLLNIEMQRACETAAKNQNQREEKFFSNQIFDL